ncbi:hypothetical protein MHU86_2395 [Fragilaria crotonensis]|nr:hypothetical protein MHU86_2395 [Fragilaria crotonensis]
MPLSLKTNHQNDEPRQQLLQLEQPQSPRTIPKNRQQLRASPPELEQDKEQEVVLTVEQELERPMEGDLEVPLVDQELEQQGRKSLLVDLIGNEPLVVVYECERSKELEIHATTSTPAITTIITIVFDEWLLGRR